MKATKRYCCLIPAYIVLMIFKVVEIPVFLCVTIQMKAKKQYFQLALLFNKLYKSLLTFQPGGCDYLAV